MWKCPRCGSGDFEDHRRREGECPPPGDRPHDVLRHLFTYHPPIDVEQLDAYQAIRKAGHRLAVAIYDHSPPGPDRTAAIRLVREACMTANAGIACGGVGIPR